ncbi:MAG: response regulator [Alphaproteobacteria bacterium]|nr:response regulator [Alphaproteobacteria bacterium]MCB1841028.1 response regulator [Alphaproteobacteria bacterium]
MNVNLLVVDDNPADRSLLKRYMSKAGNVVHIREAETAKDALTILKGREKIDCVFLDYRLPDQDGISLLKEIYDKESDLGPFPVVMLTGQGSESVIIDAIRYGAQDYLIKDNISPDTLHIAITKARELFNLKKKGSEDKALLVHTQKMKAVGQLTGGIAHDFNNLLTIIFGNTRLLEVMLNKPKPEKSECLEKVKVIQKAARRGAELVKRLMLFSRQRALEPQIINLNQLITDLDQLLQRALGDFVEIHLSLEEPIHNINVDPGQLEHAIINMAVNARDAMIEGGTLTLRTENVTLDKGEAEKLKLITGDYVCLSVTDNGLGMEEDVRKNIFEPFFTTKDPGKGTGLGLSMVYDFVRQSGGAITVQSERNQGTTFRIFIPREDVKKEEKSSEEAQEFSPVTGGHETILVVEDEEDIRFLARTILQEYGYTILEASSGQEAIDVVLREKQNIDMLFTDITMPGEINGVQAAARIQSLRPDIKLIFSTGYMSGTLPDMDLAGRYPMINKPYQPEELLSMIRKTFDG